MIKVAIIRRGDVGEIDGVNRFIFTLADGMRKLGCQVRVFGHHMTGNPSELFSVEVKTSVVSNSSAGGYFKRMWEWYVRGSEILRRFEPDMVIVNGVVPLRLKAFKIAVNHGNAIFELRKSRLKRYSTKMLYSTYDRVVCVSSKVASEMKEVGLMCDGIIPIPIILENYHLEAEREALVMHVGTAQRKRPDISVKAIEILRNLGFNVKLVLVGPYGEERDWIVMKSACPDRELRELYSKSLALIHPSYWEGFPYAVVEAQACGTPVVAGPGVPDEALINGKTGFKVSSFNPKEYAEKLRELLENESLWKYISREARKYMRNFDHLKIARRYAELVEHEIIENI
jgi:glycosyltransferase involved in cell wall biosynthesis